MQHLTTLPDIIVGCAVGPPDASFVTRKCRGNWRTRPGRGIRGDRHHKGPSAISLIVFISRQPCSPPSVKLSHANSAQNNSVCSLPLSANIWRLRCWVNRMVRRDIPILPAERTPHSIAHRPTSSSLKSLPSNARVSPPICYLLYITM